RHASIDPLLTRRLSHKGHRKQCHTEDHQQNEADENRAAAAGFAIDGRWAQSGRAGRPRRRNRDTVPTVVKGQRLLRRLAESLAVREDEATGEDRCWKRVKTIRFERLEIARRHASGTGDLVDRESSALTEAAQVVADGSHATKRV